MLYNKKIKKRMMQKSNKTMIWRKKEDVEREKAVKID